MFSLVENGRKTALLFDRGQWHFELPQKVSRDTTLARASRHANLPLPTHKVLP